jgi:hypothetical protein
MRVRAVLRLEIACLEIAWLEIAWVVPLVGAFVIAFVIASVVAQVMVLLPFPGWSSAWTTRLEEAGRLRRSPTPTLYALYPRAAKHAFSVQPQIFS